MLAASNCCYAQAVIVTFPKQTMKGFAALLEGHAHETGMSCQADRVCTR